MSKAPDVSGRDITQRAQEALQESPMASGTYEGYYDDLIYQKARVYRKTALVRAVQMEHDFVVNTLEGTMRAKKGDYLCKGQDGEFWPVKQEIFESIYVLADD